MHLRCFVIRVRTSTFLNKLEPIEYAVFSEYPAGFTGQWFTRVRTDRDIIPLRASDMGIGKILYTREQIVQ